MKIYEPKPLKMIRLTITKKGEDTKYLNFVDTTQEECMKVVMSVIDELKLSVFQGGQSTRIDFRECVGGKNGSCKSVSFKGLSPTQLHDLLEKKIDKV